MKTSLLKMLAVVAVPSMLAVGCGGSDKTTTVTHDLAVTKPTGDMAASSGCTTVAAFPSDMVFAENDSDTKGLNFFVAGQEANAKTAANSDQIQYTFASNSTTSPTLPHVFTATSADTVDSTCNAGECVLGFFNVPSGDDGSTELYLAQSGTVTLSKFTNSPTGAVDVTGSSLHFVHWDASSDGKTDQADPDGSCYDVTAFNFNTTFTPPPDMGN